MTEITHIFIKGIRIGICVWICIVGLFTIFFKQDENYSRCLKKFIIMLCYSMAMVGLLYFRYVLHFKQSSKDNNMIETVNDGFVLQQEEKYDGQ